MGTTTPSATGTSPKTIHIVSHSMLFYWWPVWLTSLIFGVISLVGAHKMVVVPEGTMAVASLDLTDPKLRAEIRGYRDVYVLPEGQRVPLDPRTRTVVQPRLQVASSPRLGVLFVIVLLLVVIITNVPLRGWGSVVAVACFCLALGIFAALGYLDVNINMGGYLFIGGILFTLWLVVLVAFDPQVYLIFTPKQMRVRLERGSPEMVYDTAGMKVQHLRGQLLLHLILGLGAGDLVVRTSGAQTHQFDLPNVLAVGRKAREIQELLRAEHPGSL